MDPYLEHPSLWPDVHNRLIAAMADALAPLVAPDFFVGLERRAYLLKPDDLVLIGRPDVSVTSVREPAGSYSLAPAGGPVWVDVPMDDEVGENYLEIHEVLTGRLVTLLELLSPANKISPDGRQQYLQKREQVLRTRTSLLEVDLLRAGAPMPCVGRAATGDYRILVSRGWQRPRAQLFTFSLRQLIPAVPVPLLPGRDEPALDLNAVLHAMYERARYDLRLDYARPAVPPLGADDAAWAAGLAGA
jgi:hypothetical protein